MSFLIDVAVPEMALNALVYTCNRRLKPGARVIVEVKSSRHVGFVLGLTKKAPSPEITIKPIEGIIDLEPVVPPDILDMSVWAGKACLCGVGASLKAVLPKALIMGEKADPPPEYEHDRTNFHESNCFNPFDIERVNFYISQLEKPERTLILFPTKEGVRNFYNKLPEHLKSESLLWPNTGGVKLWEAWKLTNSGQVRIIIGSPGGVFAPLQPQRIIVYDESNPSHSIPYSLNISSRSLAGRRALYLGAEFITGGRIPSLKTFMRTNPQNTFTPDRKNIILADIYHRSRKAEENGIEGSILLTPSLLRHTLRELSQKHNVIWILNRNGEASEVVCSNCGKSVRCERCGSIMTAKNDGNILLCGSCGHAVNLPDKCGYCGYNVLKGKNPGTEALMKIMKRYYNDVNVYVEGSRKSDMHGLIISTQRGLELCGSSHPGLIAWLDIDSDLSRSEYNTRLNVFSMLWESYWRGRTKASRRKVLIQCRKKGLKLARYFLEGWQKFMTDELHEREEFMLPPFGYVVEIECGDKDLREEMINNFDEAGIFVMDPGNDEKPLYINTDSIDAVAKILEPKIIIRNMKREELKITVRSD